MHVAPQISHRVPAVAGLNETERYLKMLLCGAKNMMENTKMYKDLLCSVFPVHEGLGHEEIQIYTGYAGYVGYTGYAGMPSS